MNKFYEKHFNGFWSVFSGIVLLIFAFVALIMTNNSKSNIPVQETTTKNIEINIQETTEEQATEKVSNNNSPVQDINLKAKFPYMIKINRAQNYTIIYGIDKNGEYSIPYKGFICSTGYYPVDTPLGTYETSDMYRWRMMVDYTYSQYAIRINGAIMLHSLPYYEQSNDTLKYEEYNLLGNPASLGCIRYQAKDIKWIYKNCPKGTPVEIYEDYNEKPPLIIPKIVPIKKNNPNKNWDPTDPDKNNPWKKNQIQKSNNNKVNKPNKKK